MKLDMGIDITTFHPIVIYIPEEIDAIGSIYII